MYMPAFVSDKIGRKRIKWLPRSVHKRLFSTLASKMIKDSTASQALL